MRGRGLLLLIVVAACGADNTDGITFTTNGVPALFDAKLDDGTWQTYKPKYVYQGNATYNIPTFLSTIDAVFVCEDANGGFAASETRTTDSNDLGMYCVTPVDTGDRQQLVVTVHDASPYVRVNAYDVDDQSTGSEAQFSIQAPEPAVDLIALDHAHLLVVPDVDTSKGAAEVTVDMATAPPFVIGHYTFDPPDVDETLTDIDLFWTANGSRMRLSNGLGEYAFPDPSLIAADDEMDITLLALNLTSNRSVAAYKVDPSTTFATHWLPRITATFDTVRTAATFAPYAIENDSLGVSCSGMGSQESVSIERGYRDLRSDDVSFTEEIPGWRWTLSSTGRRCQATVFQFTTRESYADTAFVMQPTMPSLAPTPSSGGPSDSRSSLPWQPARARRHR